jgi:hypothetical protein
MSKKRKRDSDSKALLTMPGALETKLHGKREQVLDLLFPRILPPEAKWQQTVQNVMHDSLDPLERTHLLDVLNRSKDKMIASEDEIDFQTIWPVAAGLLSGWWPTAYKDQEILDVPPGHRSWYEDGKPLQVTLDSSPSQLLRDLPPASLKKSVHVDRDALKRVHLFQGEASPEFVALQKKYYMALPRLTRLLIQKRIINQSSAAEAYRGYRAELSNIFQTSESPGERQTRQALLEKFAKDNQRDLFVIEDAILRAPRTTRPLILYHGQNSMYPLQEIRQVSGPSPLDSVLALSFPIGSSFYTRHYLSFDNNLTLSLFGRIHHSKGYWGDLCCLWRVHVPPGTPLLFIEGRDHVLVPRHSLLTITGKRTIRVPLRHSSDQAVVMMYDMNLKFEPREF